jgi:hypothetical protein
MADAVYKCVDANGHVAYQDHACAQSSHQSEVAILPPPAHATVSGDENARPKRAKAEKAGPKPRSRSSKKRDPEHAGPGERAVVSFECHAANGEVFYRHSACPTSIAGTPAAPHGRNRGASRGRGKGAESLPVTATEMPRADACRQLARAGSIGRAGHERDETVSTYDRNAGRDPCRYY